MARKTRDFGALKAGLSTLSSAPSEPIPVNKQGRGRPNADTQAMTLRLPTAVYAALVKAAASASIAEGRNVTPQQIILRSLEATYG